MDKRRALEATTQVPGEVGHPWGILRGTKPKLKGGHQIVTGYELRGGVLSGYLKILSKHRGLVDNNWRCQVGTWKYWQALGRYWVSTRGTRWELSPHWESLSLFQGTWAIVVRSGDTGGHWVSTGSHWACTHPGQDSTSPAVPQCPLPTAPRGWIIVPFSQRGLRSEMSLGQ